MNVLVVAAHPDDEVLGCGGTIARLASEGHNVSIIILGVGITSRYANPDEAKVDDLKTLHAAAKKAGTSLGAKDVTVMDFPDNRFDTVPLLDIIKVIEAHIEKIKPEIVYTQHGGDLNIDHSCTFRAVMTSTRPMAGSPVKQLLAYEVGSSTEWSFQQFSPIFRANVFSDISTTLEKKIAAMEMYESEARKFPHPRSPEALRAQALRWGSVSGLHAAEAFSLIWSKE